MKRLAFCLAIALPWAAAVAEDAAPVEKLLQERAASIVNVKFVLKISMTMAGQSQDQEANVEARGVLVDPSGLVMLANDHFEGSIPARLRNMLRQGGGSFGASPSRIKVLFANESKEYDAAIVARDSNLGLAFLQILDLEGRQVSAVDISKGVEARIGTTYYSVTRMPRGFDCVPRLLRVHVSAKVEKPRPMWAVETSPEGRGLPAFDATGGVVGILAEQQGSEGVEEEADVRMLFSASEGTFLLPLDQVQRAVQASKERAPDAVKKALEERAEPPKEPPPAEAPAKEPEKPGGN